MSNIELYKDISPLCDGCNPEDKINSAAEKAVLELVSRGVGSGRLVLFASCIKLGGERMIDASCELDCNLEVIDPIMYSPDLTESDHN